MSIRLFNIYIIIYFIRWCALLSSNFLSFCFKNVLILFYFYQEYFLESQLRIMILMGAVILLFLYLNYFLTFFYICQIVTKFMILIYPLTGILLNIFNIPIFSICLLINDEFFKFIYLININIEYFINAFQCLYFCILNFKLYLFFNLRAYNIFYYVSKLLIDVIHNDIAILYLRVYFGLRIYICYYKTHFLTCRYDEFFSVFYLLK